MALLSACSFSPPSQASSDDAPGSSGGPPGEAGGCPDDDGDGVCNDADTCPGFDDHVDTDHDGIPDGCDDWPCGQKPAAPGTITQNPWRVENLKLDNGSSLVTAKQNTAVTITAKVSMFADCGFGPLTCDAQVYYGSDPGSVTGCLMRGTFANGFTNSQDTTKTIKFDLAGGTSPKVVEIKAAGEEGFSDCRLQWPDDTPNENAVIGKVCVTP